MNKALKSSSTHFHIGEPLGPVVEFKTQLKPVQGAAKLPQKEREKPPRIASKNKEAIANGRQLEGDTIEV
jgi:hypothetical protein